MESENSRSGNPPEGLAEIAVSPIDEAHARGLPATRRASSAPVAGPPAGTLRVLFVCTGNVCRSPMAEAVGRGLADAAGIAVRMAFDSAGLGAVVGAPIDPRARTVLEREGYAARPRRARQVQARDFVSHDLVVAMERRHLEGLRQACPSAQAHKLRLLLDFAPGVGSRDIPDPYYGNAAGFAQVLRLCEAGVRGLLWAPGDAAGRPDPTGSTLRLP